jgi:hypothetical protein
MGRWLATVRFPDGTRKYGEYSTVVEQLLSRLYAEMCPEGGTLPDGSTCYRAQPVGEPDPGQSGAEPAPPGELVPVVVTTEPDGQTWHALFCPRRAVVLGPLSPHHRRRLQERFELVPDDGAVRHLRPVDVRVWPDGPPPVAAACGRPVPGEPLPFNAPWRSDGSIGYEDVPAVDLYADWARGNVCRECLASQLPEAGPDPRVRRPGPVFAGPPPRHPAGGKIAKRRTRG